MRVKSVVLAAVVASLVFPASALDVVFTGLVVDTCSLAIATPGIMTLGSSGTVLGSDQPLGVPATVNIVSLGSNRISLAAPTLESHPAAYTSGAGVLSMNYTGLANHPLFSTLGLDFVIGLLPLTSLLVNVKITDAGGFAQGTYIAKTVLTCS